MCTGRPSLPTPSPHRPIRPGRISDARRSSADPGKLRRPRRAAGGTAMNDVSIIDHFLNICSAYIASGCGVRRGEVACLTATRGAIDMTLAGLYWGLGHATGQGEDVMAKLIRKVLYVGAFAYIIGN